MRLKIPFLVLSGLAIASPALAETYLVGSGDNQGKQFYIDTSRITSGPYETTAWIVKVGFSDEGNGYSYAFEKFDCNRRMSGLMSVATYDLEGKLKQSADFETVKMSYVTPDSLGEASLNFVCAKPEDRPSIAVEKVPDGIKSILSMAATLRILGVVESGKKK